MKAVLKSLCNIVLDMAFVLAAGRKMGKIGWDSGVGCDLLAARWEVGGLPVYSLSGTYQRSS